MSTLRWATASPEFAKVMASLEKNAIAKAAAAAVDAADMVSDVNGGAPAEAAPGAPAGMQGAAPAPEPTMSEMLAEVAQQEPDQMKQQVLLDAANRFAMIDAPPEPPPQAQPAPAAASAPGPVPPGPGAEAAQPGMPGAVAQPPQPPQQEAPKTASTRFAHRVPSTGGNDGATYTTERYLAFIRSH